MKTDNTLPLPFEGESKIDIFRKKEIRKVLHGGEWWFVANDIISALTDTPDPNGYIKKMRQRDEGFREAWGQIVTPLPFQTSGGLQNHNCVNEEGVIVKTGRS
jgi:DNA-damage-inducible protein D